jgi:Zinc knuckle
MSDNEETERTARMARRAAMDEEAEVQRVARDMEREARARATIARAGQAAAVAASVAPGPPNPRIGGGTDSATWWTGGPNIRMLSRPHTYHAGRPSDFKSAAKVQELCTKGLAENRQIGTEDDKDNSITLTAWVNEIRAHMEQKGMDTVFWIQTSPAEEYYLLKDWGELNGELVEDWIVELKNGVAGKDVCQFDQDNLMWSAVMIKNSMSVRLWEEIEANLDYEASGPEIFMSVLERFQHSSSSAVRSLVKKLQELKLVKEPGMNVDTFTKKVSEVVRRIQGQKASSVPADLSVIVAQCYLDTDIDEFKLEASRIFNIVDRDPEAISWRDITTELKTKYRSLVGLDRWPHKGGKAKQDEMAALQGSINALTEKVGKMSNGQGVTKSGAEVKCYNCGEEGHMSRECTKPRTTPTSTDAAWKKKAPEEGQPHTKTVSGSEYKWCTRCGRWRKDANRHLTEAHKTKTELAAGNGGNGAPAPAPAAAPAPAPAPVAAANPQGNIGGLRMMGGLFCGVIKQTDSHLN